MQYLNEDIHEHENQPNVLFRKKNKIKKKINKFSSMRFLKQWLESNTSFTEQKV